MACFLQSIEGSGHTPLRLQKIELQELDSSSARETCYWKWAIQTLENIPQTRVGWGWWSDCTFGEGNRSPHCHSSWSKKFYGLGSKFSFLLYGLHVCIPQPQFIQWSPRLIVMVLKGATMRVIRWWMGFMRIQPSITRMQVLPRHWLSIHWS